MSSLLALRSVASWLRVLTILVLTMIADCRVFADTLTDELDDLSKVYRVSDAGVQIVPSDPAHTGGDTSIAMRVDNSNNPAYLVYRAPGAQQLTVLAQFLPNNEPIVDFTFYFSSDETSWTQQTNWISTDNATWGGWGMSRLYFFSSLPSNTNFIKIQFRTGGIANWTPELSRVEIVYTPPPSTGGSIFQSPSGNYGIGTTNPSVLLQVNNSSNFSPGSNVTGAIMTEGYYGGGYLLKDGSQYAGLWTSDNGSTLNFSAGGTSSGFSGWGGQMVLSGGKIGIGTAHPSDTLTVNGSIRALQVTVASVGADFVFAEDYKLLPLSDLEARVRADKHLPDIPSAKEMEANGLSIGEMQTKLLQKVEELTLYMIDLKKDSAALERENEALKARITTLETK